MSDERISSEKIGQRMREAATAFEALCDGINQHLDNQPDYHQVRYNLEEIQGFAGDMEALSRDLESAVRNVIDDLDSY